MKKHEKGQYFRNFIVFLKDPHPFDSSYCVLINQNQLQVESVRLG